MSRSYSGRAAQTTSTVVAAVESVAHSAVLSVAGQCRTERVGATVIVAATAVHVPAVSATIGGIEMRASEIVVVTMRIAGINGKMPVACAPVKRTEEIRGCAEHIPLPAIEDIAQVEVAALPVGTINVIHARDAHQVVEVDLVRCFVLGISQVELVGHLVGQEQSFPAGLLIAHGGGRCRHCQQGYQCK